MRKVAYKVEFFQDIERATNIARMLYDQFKNKTGFFEGYEMPEYVPPSGLDRSSREYALYLTYVIAIDFQTNAVKLWSRVRNLYENDPKLFEPEIIMNLEKDYLRSIVRSLGARYPSGGADGWKKISKILLDKYEGDPKNLTKEQISLEELRRRLQEFPYLRGKKLNTFYIRAMGENGLFKISDFDKLSVAVDIQVARVTFYTGALKITGSYYGCIHHEPIRTMIEDTWSQAAKNLEIPAWYLDEPLWSVGSKLCSKKACHRCPIKEFCQKNFEVKFKGANIQS
jgi:hypothetical protein